MVQPVTLPEGGSRDEALALIREKAIAASKKRIHEVVGRDALVIQAVSALDELNDTSNLLGNRLREWYGLHAPEKLHGVSSPEKCVAIVKKREGGSPMGLKLEPPDFSIIDRHAVVIEQLFSHKQEVESYLESIMTELAPNLTALGGANIAARLISKAGSLEKLARTPASTIQVYGAERALFKHLLKGTAPPKHGIIFQHPSILGAKRSQRGKIARALAGKLAISARIDLYSKELNPDIVKSFEERLAAIKGEN